MSILRTFVLAVLLPAGALRSAPAKDDAAWPREIRSGGSSIVLYEPQVESMKGDLLKVRAAISVTPKGQTDPVFGALWATAKMRTDRDARTVTMVSTKVDRLRFPEITDEQEATMKGIVEKETGHWQIVVGLDQLAALLASAERERKTSDELKSDPPKILVEKELAVLVVIDGEPRLQAVESSSLQRVVNTPFGILFDPKAKAYFISNGDFWYQSRAATGPYAPVARPTAEVAKVTEAMKKARKDAQKEAQNDAPKDGAGDAVEKPPKTETPPKLLVTTEPAELISFDGPPDYVPVQGVSDLLYAKNTEGSVLVDLGSQRTFVLLSGRWFAAKTLEGPWTFVASDKLPASFAKIPAGAPVADALSFVAGTPQAEDALLDAEIPQTTAVNRSDASLKVQYDGAPKFEDIPGTGLNYAVNSSTQVLSQGAKYYACDQGVWYVSDSPDGPWAVSTTRPDTVDQIPPSSPAYNTKYVYIYDSTPDVVYVGYTPGYMGSYAWGPTVVYGTGWNYRPWYGTYYYPRPYTWGFRVGYNPWGGWSFGCGYSSGFYSWGLSLKHI